MKRLAVTIAVALVVGLAFGWVPTFAQAPASAAKKAPAKAVRRRQRRHGAIRMCRGPGRPTTCAACRRSGRTSSRAASELSDAEFAKRVDANNQTRTRELNRVGAFRNDVGTRTFRQTSLVVEPADGRIPPMTPEAQARGAAVAASELRAGSWLDRSFYDRCITRGVLGSIMPVIYGNGNMIFQAPGYVTITYEMVHDTRIIPLDGRPHVGKNIRQYLGDARGHWEGNTLVVETTNFLGNTTGVGGNGGGTRHERGAAPDRALHARRARHPQLRGHDRRSQDLHAAVEAAAAADGESRVSGAPLRVSRRQSGDREHPQRGSLGRSSHRRGSEERA